jgi:iron complex transport system substrate-binding protein
VENPQKIVSLDPGDTEILFAIGLGDNVVAVCDESDEPEEVATITKVGTVDAIDTDQVIKMKPDLILANKIQLSKIVPALEKAKLSVLVLDPESIEEIEEAILLVGDVAGAQAAATELVDSMRSRVKAITDITSKLSLIDRTTTLYVMKHSPLLVAGNDTLVNDIIEKAGGENIAKGKVSGYSRMEWEDVVSSDPEVVFTSIDFGEGVGYNAPFDFVMTDSSTAGLSAVENQRVFPIWYEVIDRPGPRIVDGLEEMYALLAFEPNS